MKVYWGILGDGGQKQTLECLPLARDRDGLDSCIQVNRILRIGPILPTRSMLLTFNRSFRLLLLAAPNEFRCVDYRSRRFHSSVKFFTNRIPHHPILNQQWLLVSEAFDL